MQSDSNSQINTTSYNIMKQRHDLRKQKVYNLNKKIEELETEKEKLGEQLEKANFDKKSVENDRDANKAYIA